MVQYSIKVRLLQCSCVIIFTEKCFWGSCLWIFKCKVTRNQIIVKSLSSRGFKYKGCRQKISNQYVPSYITILLYAVRRPGHVCVEVFGDFYWNFVLWPFCWGRRNSTGLIQDPLLCPAIMSGEFLLGFSAASRFVTFSPVRNKRKTNKKLNQYVQFV